MKNLVGGRTYYFQVFANSATNYGASDQVKFAVPARVKHKAITAGVVGGILFFIVAIILSICAVKICNKRKRRKQEKGRAASLRDASLGSIYICILDLYPFESGTWARGPLLFLNFSIRFRCRFTFHSPIIIIIKNWEGMCFVGKEKRGKKGPGNAGAGRKQPGQPEPLTRLT